MVKIRFHGRGGQGAVTSAEIMAHAAIHEGKYAHAFPSFGPERRGAPVVAFLRVSDEPIKVRTSIHHPDIVVVLDSSVWREVNVAEGLVNGGFVVMNSTEPASEIKNHLGLSDARIALVDASKISLEEIGLPITNMAMLGALLRVWSGVKMESVERFIKERFGRVADKNIRAFRRAYEEVKIEEV